MKYSTVLLAMVVSTIFTALVLAEEGATMTSTLVIRFDNDARVRLDDSGQFTSTYGALDSLRGWIESRGAAVSRLFERISDERLEELRELAGSRSGRVQPDFAGTYKLVFSESRTHTNWRPVMETLRQFPHVRFVEHWSGDSTTPPQTSTTPLSAPWQADETGRLRVEWARDVMGVNGEGAKVWVLESAWAPVHEDLALDDTDWVHPYYTSSQIDDLDIYHGTATLGVLAATDNGLGYTGIVPAAEIVGYSNVADPAEEGNQGWGTIIMDIIERSGGVGNGAVILIEAQSPIFTPVETYYSIVFDAIRCATDMGFIIVEPSGNGNDDLDDEVLFADWYAEADDSSGAIMVAGSNTNHAHRVGCFGDRVDLHCTVSGDTIRTLSYSCCPLQPCVSGAGTTICFDSLPERSYHDDTGTGGFTGTSGASAAVAGAIASIQSYRWSQGLPPLHADQMRSLLTLTGTPQNSWDALTKPIGPMPDLEKAIEAIGTEFIRGDCNGDGVVNIGDPTRIMNILFGVDSTDCEDSCNANGDSAFDIADSLYILSWLFHSTAPPAAPWPNCGIDLNVDALWCLTHAGCP